MDLCVFVVSLVYILSGNKSCTVKACLKQQQQQNMKWRKHPVVYAQLESCFEMQSPSPL